MANWGSLKKIEGHHGYSVDIKSGIIYWRGTINSKHRKVSTGETQISKARKYIDAYRLGLTSDNVARSQRDQKGVLNPTIYSIWNECTDERIPTVDPKTILRYGTVWRSSIEPFWGDKHISDVTAKSLVAYENWFMKERAGMSFSQSKKYMGMVLNYMHREGYLKKKLKVRDLDKTIDGKLRRVKPYRVYSAEEQAALIEYAVTPRARLLIKAYFDTGARKEELLSLKRTQVDLEKGIVTLWSSKNKQWRDVPMTRSLTKEFKAWIDKHPVGLAYLFPMVRSRTRPIYSQLFDDEWVATKKAAGIKGRARNHDTRHTYATKTATDNWPITVACKVLDMTAKTYMNTYCHITTEDILHHVRRSFG